MSLTQSDHSLHWVRLSVRAEPGSLWLQTDSGGGGNRLGARDVLVVMGLIIAAVMSLSQVDEMKKKHISTIQWLIPMKTGWLSL